MIYLELFVTYNVLGSKIKHQCCIELYVEEQLYVTQKFLAIQKEVSKMHNSRDDIVCKSTRQSYLNINIITLTRLN
jgi:hypothetical protein